MEITINQELAAKLTGKQADELKAALYKEGGEELKDDAADALYRLILDKFKATEREAKEQQYNRGIREKGEAIGKELRPLFEKYGISTDKVEDGIRELSEKIPTPGDPGTTGPQDLTADQIKKLPAYQSLLDSELDKIRTDRDNWKTQFETFKTQTERSAIVTKAREAALSILDGKNAVWGPDKARQLDYFFRAIGTDHITIKDGELHLIDSDGNPLRDDARNQVKFDSYILSAWKEAGYQFHEAPPGSGTAGAKPGGAAGSGSIVVNSPEHYERLLKDAGADMAKKVEVRQAYAEYLKTQAQQ